MKHTFLRGSTALAVIFALSVSPHHVAVAQDGAAEVVDCTLDPQNPACAEAPPAEEAPPVEETPVETPTPEEALPVPEAIEEAVPEPEPVAEDSPPADEPVAEEPAPAEEPVADEAPAEEAPVEEPAPTEEPVPLEEAPAEAPVEEVPLEPEVPVEEAPPATEEQAPVEDAPTDQTPAEQPADETPAEGQESEPTSTEETPTEAAPAEEDRAQDTPAEQTTEPSPVEEAPAEQPVEQDPVEETPAEAEPVEEQPTDEQPPEGTEDSRDAPAQETGASPEPPATETEDGEQQAAPASESDQDLPAEAELPPEVIPDDITEEQRAQIEAEEQRRREEARQRRMELLGAAAVGAGIGMLIPALGGTVVEDQGDRIIVERDGEYFVRKDESSLLRDGDVEVRVERLRNGRTQETVTRRNGVQIVSVRDQGGYLLYRSRILPDGREYVLVDNRDIDDRVFVDFDRRLPPLVIDIPRDIYIVPAGRADYDVIFDTFTAPPVETVEQAYTLRQVRESERLRDKVRRVDLDTITFETGSATVRRSQVPQLEDIARASVALIERDPSTVLLVEGHTDAVGTDVYNLALSDRRAETVARILADVYGVPPENMVVQGYGEQYLKVDTQDAEERNRRVTIRNITPLITAQQ